MTKEKYLDICEQMGKEPNEDRCPPDLEDFPHSVQSAILIFNKLGDRIYPDIGFIGKDYGVLADYRSIYKIDPDDELFLETLTRLETYMINKSQEQLEKARKAAKRK